MKEDIKQRIKRLRLESGLTQIALSEISGVSLKTIKDLENGRSKGSVETLKSLAKGLGMDLSELTGEELPKTSTVIKLPKFNSKFISKAIQAIPDDVYELALQVSDEDQELCWESVRGVLEYYAEKNADKIKDKAYKKEA